MVYCWSNELKTCIWSPSVTLYTTLAKSQHNCILFLFQPMVSFPLHFNDNKLTVPETSKVWPTLFRYFPSIRLQEFKALSFVWVFRRSLSNRVSFSSHRLIVTELSQQCNNSPMVSKPSLTPQITDKEEDIDKEGLLKKLLS